MAQSRLLVIKHGAFGDLVQALGALHDIRLAYPDAQITLLTSPQFASLMQRCPDIDNCILDARSPMWAVGKLLRLYRQLTASQFDLVIDLQNSSRTALYQKWVFRHTQWIGRSTREPIPSSGLKGLIALLDAYQIKSTYLQSPDIHWLAEDVTSLLRVKGIGSPNIVLIPGASAAHQEKRWPYYGPLAEKLMALGYEVVNVLGPDELGLAPALKGHVLSGLTWFQLAGVIAQASFVIGNDTGPSHLASCLQKKGLAIFGPTTSASRSALARFDFETIESDHLSQLTVDAVINHFLLSIGVRSN